MNRPLILIALLFQVVALAWMAIEREWILQTGETVFLRTAPIDPRDLFRGDYVRLNYELTSFSSSHLRDGLAESDVKKGDRVYVPLTLDERGLASSDRATDIEPEDGLYLRGRVPHSAGFNIKPHAIHVKFGIEQYFTEQGKGKEIEKQQGGRNGIQVPLEMEVALSDSGVAVIKGHRWSPLGIGLSVTRAVERNPLADASSVVVKLTLKNTSDKPLALVMLPDLCSFALTSVKTAPDDLTLLRPECEIPAASREHVVQLAPDEELSHEFDFNLPRWHVKLKDGQRVPIGTLVGGQRFRLIYRSVLQDPLSRSGQTNLWTGSLPSRAFHGRGHID